MAKKQTKPRCDRTNIVIWEKYYLKTKYQEKALIPAEAIDKNWLGIWCYNDADIKLKDSAMFVTTDGHRVKIKLIACCNNSKGDESEWLSKIAQELYDVKFEVIQSHWFARLGRLGGYWCLIEMEKTI